MKEYYIKVKSDEAMAFGKYCQDNGIRSNYVSMDWISGRQTVIYYVSMDDLEKTRMFLAFPIRVIQLIDDKL